MSRPAAAEANGLAASAAALAATDSAGASSEPSPKAASAKKSSASSQKLQLGRVDKGTRRRGEVVFRLPFGVNPLVLIIRADKASHLEIAL